MRVPYHPVTAAQWSHHFCSGSYHQVGSGINGFSGMPYQRGAGLGSFFMGLFRRVVPLLKTAAKVAGKQALATAATVAGDVARGQDIGESMKARGKESVAELADKASAYLKGPGSGTTQSGSGLKSRKMYTLGKKEPKKIKKKKRTKAIKEFPLFQM